ncbi:MAG: phenylalanine--tRNA ligase subunit alpha [Atribacterota bacterium]|nr:phenylalanine--tRNA ligase subunit alpha [Atribacterota bacterium]MDD5637025.1 phenylalanine--tRNA ligase subunit alpha [Atribacterota bacterium]
MEKEIKNLIEQFNKRIAAINNKEELKGIKNEYIGRKGLVTQMLKRIASLPAEDKPKAGMLLNQIKEDFQIMITEKDRELLKEESKEDEQIDITIPGRNFISGTIHPIELILKATEEIFLGMGFCIVDGPEIELDYYNFEALNIPKDHPVRDDQDSIYITSDILLRTQTSPMQVRTMENQSPPVRIISTGKCYRRDSIDNTHTPMFHQIEGLAVDKDISLADLKGVIAEFCKQIFGKDRIIRFRPGYFPFVEPGAEVDVSCGLCKGKGCPSCGYSGWLEIMGAGMVHPHVLEMVGYDTEKYTGFAFGMGAERIAMLKYGINDIRLFFENDLRFLTQFK